MSRYEELIKALRETIAPDDVLGAVISQIRTDELPTDPLIIHGVIQKLRDEFPDLLSEFLFFEGSLYPFSELLERVLFRLESSSVLGTVNPSYEIYLIPEKTKKELAQRVFSRFPLEKQEQIKLLAERFEAEVTATPA